MVRSSISNLEKRILGIDVGFAIAGWSIIDRDPSKKNKMSLIAYGVIKTGAKLKIAQRLDIIFNEISNLIDDYKPDAIAIENLFYFKNKKTVISVSQARGVILLAAERKGLIIYDYTPLQVKTSVTGYGRADKKQVQKMTQIIFNLAELPEPDDAADAIAVAICHISTTI